MENQNFVLHVGISALNANVKLQRWRSSSSDFFCVETNWYIWKWAHIYRVKWQVCIYLMLYKILEHLKNLTIWGHPFPKESFWCQHIEKQYICKVQMSFRSINNCNWNNPQCVIVLLWHWTRNKHLLMMITWNRIRLIDLILQNWCKSYRRKML